MKHIKKVAIIGRGALGIMYGQQLTEKLGKEHVFFIADNERIARYMKENLTCNQKLCDFRYVSADSEQEKADLIIFAVKFNALGTAIKNAANFVQEDTVFLSVLNGIASEEVIAKAYGEKNMLYCTAHGMDALKSGNQMIYKNMGVLVIGNKNNEEDNKLVCVRELFQRAEIPYSIPKDIMHSLWSKLMLNTGVNQTAAVFACTYQRLQEEGEVRNMVLDAMREVQKIARCEGVQLTNADIENWMEILDSLAPEGMPSMRQDTKAGRKTEVELFSGTIRKLGKKHGIETPINDYLYQKIMEIENNMYTLQEGRPADETGRLQKEIKTYDFLDKLKISYQRVDHPAMATVADCVQVDTVLEIDICKNLFLCNSQKTRFYLLLMTGNKKFVTKELSRKLGIARLSFAKEEFMERLLDITPGSVSIMGLVHDKEHKVQLIIDHEVLQAPYIACHPCINTSSIRIKTEDILEKFLPASGHEPVIVELSGE